MYRFTDRVHIFPKVVYNEIAPRAIQKNAVVFLLKIHYNEMKYRISEVFPWLLS